MLVKKNKAGKIVLSLSLYQREQIWEALINFLESESIKVGFLKLTTDSEVMRALYFHCLEEMLIKQHFQLQMRMTIKWTLTVSQALALMWLLRSFDEMPLIDLKSDIHKTLHS